MPIEGFFVTFCGHVDVLYTSMGAMWECGMWQKVHQAFARLKNNSFLPPAAEQKKVEIPLLFFFMCRAVFMRERVTHTSVFSPKLCSAAI